MNSELVSWLNLTGSILSILSFFPIMGAAILWLRNQTFKTITLKDRDGNPFTVRVRRKYLNNKDLTPMIQDMYKGNNNISIESRKSILEQTLNTSKNLIHLGPKSIEETHVS